MSVTIEVIKAIQEYKKEYGHSPSKVHITEDQYLSIYGEHEKYLRSDPKFKGKQEIYGCPFEVSDTFAIVGQIVPHGTIKAVYSANYPIGSCPHKYHLRFRCHLLSLRPNLLVR